MKSLKAFGLVAIVVASAMALLASSAAAESTALCEKDESPCHSLAAHGHYTAQGLEILNSFVTYKCEGLYLSGIRELGEPQILEGVFVYSSCDHGCTRTEENGPVELELFKAGHETAELRGVAGAVVHSECSGLNCVYSFENLTATVKGPLLAAAENGELVFNAATLTHVSGALCPPVSKLDARFILLSKLYIST